MGGPFFMNKLPIVAIAQFRLQINKKKTNLFRKFVTL